jgi:AcrR family transcriptional regulator
MAGAAGTRDRIVQIAALAVGEVGMAALTIGVVAERAGVSTALVHYHFDTKAGLLVAVAEQVAGQRRARRLASFAAGRGLATLDAAWAAMQAGVEDGTERALFELALHGQTDAAIAAVLAAERRAERAGLERRLPALFQELGAREPAAPEEVAAALDALLAGLAMNLISGEAPDALRAAYDAFWLSLVAAGQSRRR